MKFSEIILIAVGGVAAYFVISKAASAGAVQTPAPGAPSIPGRIASAGNAAAGNLISTAGNDLNNWLTDFFSNIGSSNSGSGTSPSNYTQNNSGPGTPSASNPFPTSNYFDPNQTFDWNSVA